MTKAITTTTGTPAELLAVAVESGADVEKLEKLMELQERWESKEARKAFYEAMGKFQENCPEIPRTKVVTRKGGVGVLYKYAPLENTLKIVKPVMRTCGLMHRWDTAHQPDGSVRVTCTISHVAGHSETSTVDMPPTKGINTNASQDRRIPITSGKRTSLENALGISPCEDTDGIGPADEPERVSARDVAVLGKLIAETNADLGKLLRWAGVDAIEQLPADKAAEATRDLRKRKKAQKAEQAELSEVL